MRNPRLPGKIIMSAAFLLALIGVLASIVYSNFPGYISASNRLNTAAHLEIIEANEMVDNLSRTSPSWRRKLNKHIFVHIDQELNSLEQEIVLLDRTEGKRLVERVRLSLQRMIFGKQKFMRTGQESGLAAFYTGRTVLEFNLWKLKNLTEDSTIDEEKARGVHRIYALVNKWLIYVAHRDISARRKRNFKAAPRVETKPTRQQVSSEADTAFKKISEVAKITEQDIKDAGEALSQQPVKIQGTAPGIQTNVTVAENAVPRQSFENKNTSPSPTERKPGHPIQSKNLEYWNLIKGEKAVSQPNLQENVDSPESAAFPIIKVFALGAAGILVVWLLLFRKKRQPIGMSFPLFGDYDNQLETSQQSTPRQGGEYPLSKHPQAVETPGDTLTTMDLEISEDSHIETQDNFFTDPEIEKSYAESEVAEDNLFSIDELTSPIEDPEAEELAQDIESPGNGTFSEDDISADIEVPEVIASQATDNELGDDPQEEATSKFEEINPGLENALSENVSLMDKLESSHEEKEVLEKELKTLHAREEELARDLENTLTENNSLTEKLETSYEDEKNEKLEKKLEGLHTEMEVLAQGLNNTLAAKNSLMEKLESSREEKEALEKQLKLLHTREERLAQELESTLAENDSHPAKRKTSHKEEKKESMAQEQHSSNAEIEAMEETLKFTRENNITLTNQQKSTQAKCNTLTKKLESVTAESETQKKQLEEMQTENHQITEAGHKLTDDLQANSVETKFLKEKLEWAASENETLKKKLEETQNKNRQTTESEQNLIRELQANSAEAKILKEQLESAASESETLKKLLDTMQTENHHINEVDHKLMGDLQAKSAETKNLQEKLESAASESETLKKKLDEMQTENQQSVESEKNLTSELQANSVEAKILKEQLESATAESETLKKKLEVMQIKDHQNAESEQNLTGDLQAKSVEAKNLMEKLESADSENEMLKKQLEITLTERKLPDAEGTDELTRQLNSMFLDAKNIKDQLDSTYLEIELLPKEPGGNGATDPSFNDDTPEPKPSEAEESTGDIEKKALAGKNVSEGLDIPSGSIPKDSESNHPDAVMLQTILEAAKGFRNINKRLYKIAEARFTPSNKNFPEDPNGENSLNT